MITNKLFSNNYFLLLNNFNLIALFTWAFAFFCIWQLLFGSPFLCHFLTVDTFLLWL